ncbi:MAG: hypothetical protein ACJA06_000803 [Halocynthiibacter sp.]|jgi:hypothetical protein
MNRTLIYFIYHPKGRIDLYIPPLLAALRTRFDHIHVVFNGRLAKGAAAQLHMADTIQERPNTGFDVGAYRAAINALPGDGLAQIDELTLANFTFFGPLNDMQNIWDWADATDVDFWGLSAHGALDHNPFGEGALPYHLNSHWITIRAPMLHSEAFANWWQEMPKIESYADSVLHHESRFTAHFAALGFRHAAFLDPAQDGAAYPAFDEADKHIAQGFPILKRRLFYHTPVAYNDWHGGNPRRALNALSKQNGFDPNLIWQSLAGAADPWILYQNADLLFVVDSEAAPSEPYEAPNFLLHIPEELRPADLLHLAKALTTPVHLRLSGEQSEAVENALRDHPMVCSISSGGAHSALKACASDSAILMARLLRGDGKSLANDLAHIARNPSVASSAKAKIGATAAFGIAFPPVQTHGPTARADASLEPNEHPPFGQGAKVAWVRVRIANKIAASWPALESWAQIAAEEGSISIAISNSEELPRSFVKLEARYRALARQIDAKGPFEAPARLAHHIAYPQSAEAKSAWEEAADIAHDAGHTSGYNAGYAEGYSQAHTPAFEDGYQKGFEAALDQARSETPYLVDAPKTARRLLRWRA